MKKDNQKQTKKHSTRGRLSRSVTSRIRTFTDGKCLFKKVECLSSKQGKITKQDKAQVVYELRHEFPVKALLKLAGIPRSTYYYCVKRMNRPDPDADLKVLFNRFMTNMKAAMAIVVFVMNLANRGQQVNHKKVQRIMKELGLKCQVRMKKYRSYKGTVGKIAPNILIAI